MKSGPARSTARHEVVLEEHTSVTVSRSKLYGGDLDRLRAAQAVTVTENRDGYLLKVRSSAGVIELDRVRLVLRPKFPVEGQRLIEWLCYSHYQREPDETLRNWPIGRDGYAV